MRYSPSTNGFYPEDTCYINLPSDIIIISDELYFHLIDGQSAGRLITPNGSNKPYLSDPEINYVAAANAARLSLLDEANSVINGNQWPSKLQLGRLSESERIQFNQWLDYIDTVNAVDTSTAPDINWPTAPAA